MVAIVLRAFIEYCWTGKCGLFGQGGLIMYDVSSARAVYGGPDILAALFLGAIGGIFGSLYNYLVDKVLRTYSIINEYVIVFHSRLLTFSLINIKISPPINYKDSSIS